MEGSTRGRRVPRWSVVRPVSRARAAARPSATRETSTPRTSHPCAASHSASPPHHSRRRAPGQGAAPASSRTTALTCPLHRASEEPYLSSQNAASQRGVASEPCPPPRRAGRGPRGGARSSCHSLPQVGLDEIHVDRGAGHGPRRGGGHDLRPDVGHVPSDPHALQRGPPRRTTGVLLAQPDGCAWGASPRESRTAERASMRGATTTASSGTDVPSASRALSACPSDPPGRRPRPPARTPAAASRARSARSAARCAPVPRRRR